MKTAKVSQQSKTVAKKTAKQATKIATARARGGQSTFSDDKAAEICERLSKGEPLEAICRDEGMPCASTVGNWRAANAEFAGQFARARQAGYDCIAADCLRIADEVQIGEEVEETDAVVSDDGKVITPAGRKVKRSDAVQRAKLRIETRLKLLACWDPSKYGSKLALGQAHDLKPLVTVKDFSGKKHQPGTEPE